MPVVSSRIDVSLGSFFESKTTVLEGANDLPFVFGRCQDIVREISGDEE